MSKVTAIGLLIATGAVFCASGAFGLSHKIEISLFPPDRSLRAIDVIEVGPDEIRDRRVGFLINRALDVESIWSETEIERWYTEEDADPEAFKDEPDSEDVNLVSRAKAVFVHFAEGLPDGEAVSVRLEYAGVIYDSLEAPSKAYAKGFETTTGLIEERGVFLSNESLWYPFQFDRLFTFVLRVDVPHNWMAVSQGDLIDEWVATSGDEERVWAVWVESNPTHEIYLVAGKYYRHEAYRDSTWIATYTYEASDSLSKVYIDATKRYIAMYEGLIGDYPYGKFALVENFWQTGFGMPSFTLLGDKVIRLPWIVHTSYGHEILHNWWGNSVYVDYTLGNWCEGLTTYGADYLYKEQSSEAEARDYRHHTLIDFSNYVTEGRDLALSEFRERHDAPSQSVGYGKSLMVFHMLRQSLGDSLFWKGLREFYARAKFKEASWQDIAATFSEVSGEDLRWYFDQWVNRTGAPSIRLAHADWAGGDADYRLSVTIEQDDPPFIVDLPVRIETADGTETRMLRMSGRDSTYTIKTRAQPLGVAIDPDYDTFRGLHMEEIPITFGAVFSQDSVIAVIGNGEDDSTKAGLREIAETWGLGERTFDEADFDDERLSREHVWLLGRGSMMDRVLDLRRDHLEASSESAVVGDTEFSLAENNLICAFRNPYDETITMAVIIPGDIVSLQSLARRIPHYGRYSYLGFAKGIPVLKGVWEERQSPLRIELSER